MNWIRCSDRLPEIGKLVLTTIWGSDLVIQQEGESINEALQRIQKECRYVSMGAYYGEEDLWVGRDGYPSVVFPVAWAELPEPYQGEE